MPKQPRTNNQFIDDGQKRPSSNNRAMPHDTTHSRTDDVIQLKPKQKTPAVKKEKRPNANSNSSNKSPKKQPQSTQISRITSSPYHHPSRRKLWKHHFRRRSAPKFTEFLLSLLLGALFIIGFIWYQAIKEDIDVGGSISWKPKTASQRAFQKEWKKIEREEAADVRSQKHESDKKLKKKEAAEETGGAVVVESATVNEIDSEGVKTEESIKNEQSETAIVESTAENSDDNDDLVMDFLKRNVGHVGRTTAPRMTRSANVRQAAPVPQYTPIGRWSPGNLERHWAKHGHEFPQYRSAAEYGMGALNFFNNLPPGTKRKTRGNGDCLFYHPASNTFGVTTADGTPKTMFKPDSGMDYWNRQ